MMAKIRTALQSVGTGCIALGVLMLAQGEYVGGVIACVVGVFVEYLHYLRC